MSECARRARRCSVTAMSEWETASWLFFGRENAQSIGQQSDRRGEMRKKCRYLHLAGWVFVELSQRLRSACNFESLLDGSSSLCSVALITGSDDSFARQRTTTKILHLFNCQFMLRSRPRHLIAPSLLSASHVAISAEWFFVSADKLTWLLIKTITTARLWHWFVFITIEFQALRPMQVIEPLTGAVVNTGDYLRFLWRLRADQPRAQSPDVQSIVGGSDRPFR